MSLIDYQDGWALAFIASSHSGYPMQASSLTFYENLILLAIYEGCDVR
jgi:hypothetical protein